MILAAPLPGQVPGPCSLGSVTSLTRLPGPWGLCSGGSSELCVVQSRLQQVSTGSCCSRLPRQDRGDRSARSPVFVGLRPGAPRASPMAWPYCQWGLCCQPGKRFLPLGSPLWSVPQAKPTAL